MTQYYWTSTPNKYIKKYILNIHMDKEKALVVFEGKNIRRIWHNNEWYFSVVDVVAILTDSIDSFAY